MFIQMKCFDSSLTTLFELLNLTASFIYKEFNICGGGKKSGIFPRKKIHKIRYGEYKPSETLAINIAANFIWFY